MSDLILNEKIERIGIHSSKNNPQQIYKSKKRQIIIIGAGFSGLSTAYQLLHLQELYFGPEHLKDLQITILEASHRVGGRVKTIHNQFSIPIEAGAEYIHNPDYENLTFKLAQKFSANAKFLKNLFLENPYQDENFLIDISQSSKQNKISTISKQTFILLSDYYHKIDQYIFKHNEKIPEKEKLSYQQLINYVEQKEQYRTKHPQLKLIPQYLFEWMLKFNMDRSGVDANKIGYTTLFPAQKKQIQYQFQYPLSSNKDLEITDGGYDQIAQKLADELKSKGVKFLFNHTVTHINYGEENCIITSQDQNKQFANKVVCALPIEVRKKMNFTPQPNLEVKEAENFIRQGKYMKIAVEFDHPIWPKEMNRIKYFVNARKKTEPNQIYFRWIKNYYPTHQVPILMPLLSSEAANKVEKLIRSIGYKKTLERVESQLMQELQIMFSLKEKPRPKSIDGKTAIRIIDWKNNPYSQGAWAYNAKGYQDKHRDLLRRPYQSNDKSKVFFSGAYLSTQYHWTTQGALRYGIHTANQLFSSLHNIQMDELNVPILHLKHSENITIVKRPFQNRYTFSFEQTKDIKGIYNKTYSCRFRFTDNNYAASVKVINDTPHLYFHHNKSDILIAKKLPGSNLNIAGMWYLTRENKNGMCITSRMTIGKLQENSFIKSRFDKYYSAPMTFERIYKHPTAYDRIK